MVKAAGVPPAEEREAAGDLELVEVLGVRKRFAALLWVWAFRQVAESRHASPEYHCEHQGVCGFAVQPRYKIDLERAGAILPQIPSVFAPSCCLVGL